MMGSIKCLIHVFMFPLLMLISFAAEEHPALLYSSICEPFTNSKTKDTYQANVKTLLSDLKSNCTQDNGFYNTAAGWGTENSIRGQILCRGDVPLSTCHHCVSIAANKTLHFCPNAIDYIIYYDLCMLHYTNKSFQFDSSLPGGVNWSNNSTEFSDKDRFNQTVWLLLKEVTAKAAHSTLPDKKFATKEQPVTAPRSCTD